MTQMGAKATSRPKPAELGKPPPVPATEQPDRIHQVCTWILSGNCEHDIRQSIKAAWPDDACANRLIIAACKRIEAQAAVNVDLLKGWCIEATRAVYARSLEAGDFGTALRAIKQLRQFAE